MKYKAKQICKGEHEGQWAVFQGKSYFTLSICETQKQGELEALKYSARWYYDQWQEADELIAKTDPDYSSSDPHCYLA